MKLHVPFQVIVISTNLFANCAHKTATTKILDFCRDFRLLRCLLSLPSIVDVFHMSLQIASERKKFSAGVTFHHLLHHFFIIGFLVRCYEVSTFIRSAIAEVLDNSFEIIGHLFKCNSIYVVFIIIDKKHLFLSIMFQALEVFTLIVSHR